MGYPISILRQAQKEWATPLRKPMSEYGMPVLRRILTCKPSASDIGGTQLPAGESNSEKVKWNAYT